MPRQKPGHKILSLYVPDEVYWKIKSEASLCKQGIESYTLQIIMNGSTPCTEHTEQEEAPKDLYPFFSYYGGKWRIAKRYQLPSYKKIIEPFAGSAWYSLRYYERDIVLYDLDPMICGMWDYLIHATRQEIRQLPSCVRHIDDVHAPQEARWLIGYWLHKGGSSPGLTQAAWSRKRPGTESYWSEFIRDRIALHVDYIRHWKVYNRSYETIPDEEATWFIDPPYNCAAGKSYRYHDLNYTALGEWCQSRSGQVIVCEQESANWLPFRRLTSSRAVKGRSEEAFWTPEILRTISAA